LGSVSLLVLCNTFSTFRAVCLGISIIPGRQQIGRKQTTMTEFLTPVTGISPENRLIEPILHAMLLLHFSTCHVTESTNHGSQFLSEKVMALLKY
jgi:hypothetical protein